jgi:hypothetical protein
MGPNICNNQATKTAAVSKACPSAHNVTHAVQVNSMVNCGCVCDKPVPQKCHFLHSVTYPTAWKSTPLHSHLFYLPFYDEVRSARLLAGLVHRPIQCSQCNMCQQQVS